MLVNSFGSRSDEKERKTRAEGLLFPTEDDSSDEKERQRDVMPWRVLGHQKAETLGSQVSA